ncbi:MAG TPA: sulfatase [Kofleriaceae bacterium]|nr:sulfatase [Kofleriaceae bacterium]
MRAWLADPVASGVAAGLVLALVELALLGHVSGGLALAVIGLCVGAGALVGASVVLTYALARRLGLGAVPGAVLIAAPSLVLGVPLGKSLFQGAFAATLPGASVAPYLVPIVAWLGIAATVFAGGVIVRSRPAAHLVIAVVVAVGAVVLDAVNRTMFRSGYPDLHLALTFATLTLGAIGFGLGLARPPVSGRTRAITAVGAVVLVVAAALFGLDDAADRKLVATRGDDSRHLVRAARSLLDFDRDGSSRFFSGGDCDEGDAARHAGARDVPGNGKDEDCDGADAVARVAVVDEAVARSLDEWRKRGEVAKLLERTRTMNLLVISIDALRADQVDHPNLKALLARSVAFEHAFAPAAGTDISLTTFVTGRWNPFQAIATTLPEALAARGRLTHAILPREVLRYVPETLLTRGQASVDRVITDSGKRDVGNRITAGETTDRALAFLDRAGGNRFALWAHYFDVHEHLQLKKPYRELVATVDAEVGRLLADLERRALADETIVVLFSDHGESMGEDPRLPDNHGLVVYQALVHVPVAFHIPGVPARVDAAPVSLVDLAPTVLSLLGGAGPDGGITPLDGVDLVPELLDAPAELRRRDRALVMNEQDQWGVVVWPLKLLVRPKDDLTELYDISVDPTERKDLAASRPDDVKALRARYGEFPAVPMDRTTKGRRWREEQAQPPPTPR